jgi:hypothetical protein
MRVGLNNFLRFISANGASKVNQVLEALQDYRDWKDFYKDFREPAVLAIATKKLNALEVAVAAASSETKRKHYEECLDGLKEWMAKTAYTYVSTPKSASWDAGEIKIAVNPEVVIDIGGDRYIVKLYMSREKLTQPARKAFSWLVKKTHGSSAIPAILEVRKGRLSPSPAPTSKIAQWIRAEVAAFVELWKMNRAA